MSAAAAEGALRGRDRTVSQSPAQPPEEDAKTAAFTAKQREEALAALPDWSFDRDRDALYRRIVFADFSEALAFIVRVGLEAEKADHHPEWANVYNHVEIWLTTHEAGGVSDRDVAMAHVIDRLAAPATR